MIDWVRMNEKDAIKLLWKDKVNEIKKKDTEENIKYLKEKYGIDLIIK